MVREPNHTRGAGTRLVCDRTPGRYFGEVSVHEHRSHGPTSLKIGVITASDTRTPETDESGKLIKELLSGGGHKITYYEIIPDDTLRFSNAIRARFPQFNPFILT